MNVIPFFIMYFFIYETVLSSDPSSYTLFKLLSSLCFITCALLSYKKSPNSKKYSLFIISGLIFGLIGDVILTLSISNAFLLGASAFAIGHLLFIIGFTTLSPIHFKDLILTIIGSCIFVIFITHNSRFNLGNNLPIACIYSFIILFMFIKSCYLFKFRKTNRLFSYFSIIGTFLFIFSDFILTFDVFLINSPSYLSTLNLITYYSGQGLIALSLSDTFSIFSNSSHHRRNN